MFKSLQNFSSSTKKAVVIITDFLILTATHYYYLERLLENSFAYVFLFSTSFLIFLLIMERYGGFSEVIKNYSAERLLVHAAPLIIFSLFFIFLFLFDQQGLTPSIFIDPIPFNYAISSIVKVFAFSFTLISLSRVLAKVLIYGRSSSISSKKVYVFGTGENARDLFHMYENSNEYEIQGFITSNKENSGRYLFGKKIISFKKAARIFKSNNFYNVFLALDESEKEDRSKIINDLSSLKITVKSIPSYSDFMKKDKIALEELSSADILGRPENKYINDIDQDFFKNKTVLITGAGGSIGSELSKIIASFPCKTVFLDNSEYNLYELEEHFSKYKMELNICFELANIRDNSRMRKIFKKHQPDFVFHAAAYKHVPIIEQEDNFTEAIKTNIFGTLNIGKLCDEFNVSRFVFVSTDKAVRPTNLMGATKRISERLIETISHSSNTIYSSVRFGNVLQSSGSVIPKFKQQIQAGGPLTVTHKEMTRYFMTINEAASLVIHASILPKKYSTYLLKMGSPVKIYDLATKMINLYGFDVRDKNNPDSGIEIIFTGMREGEKIYEELLVSGNEEETENEMIFTDKSEKILSTDDAKLLVKELEEIILHDDLKAFKEVCILHADYGNGN